MDQVVLLSEIAKTERSLAESRDRAKELEGIIAQLDQGSPDIQPLADTGGLGYEGGAHLFAAGLAFIVVLYV